MITSRSECTPVTAVPWKRAFQKNKTDAKSAKRSKARGLPCVYVLAEVIRTLPQQLTNETSGRVVRRNAWKIALRNAEMIRPAVRFV